MSPPLHETVKILYRVHNTVLVVRMPRATLAIGRLPSHRGDPASSFKMSGRAEPVKKYSDKRNKFKSRTQESTLKVMLKKERQHFVN